MRVMQATFMDVNKYHDIAYHFVIGADNTVYEGRGWFLRGALEEDFNMKSLSFAYIGSETPTGAMVQFKDKLIECGKTRNYIKKEAVIQERASVDGFPTLQMDPSTSDDLTGQSSSNGDDLTGQSNRNCLSFCFRQNPVDDSSRFSLPLLNSESYANLVNLLRFHKWENGLRDLLIMETAH